MKKLTAQQYYDNLINHAEFIKNLDDESEINMKSYHSESGSMVRQWVIDGNHPCGSTMCVIGWASENKDLPPPNVGESWLNYAFRIFGTNDSCKIGEMCFGLELPNDPEFLSKRMIKVAGIIKDIAELDKELTDYQSEQ